MGIRSQNLDCLVGSVRSLRETPNSNAVLIMLTARKKGMIELKRGLTFLNVRTFYSGPGTTLFLYNN